MHTPRISQKVHPRAPIWDRFDRGLLSETVQYRELLRRRLLSVNESPVPLPSCLWVVTMATTISIGNSRAHLFPKKGRVHREITYITTCSSRSIRRDLLILNNRWLCGWAYRRGRHHHRPALQTYVCNKHCLRILVEAITDLKRGRTLMHSQPLSQPNGSTDSHIRSRRYVSCKVTGPSGPLRRSGENH